MSSSFQRVGRHMRGDWLKIWIASQPRSTPRSCAFTRPPAVETWAPISIAMADYEGTVRAFSHRRAARRRGARRHCTTGFSPAGAGGELRAAHRGHRPRALDPRERRADPRRAALARARLGRGAVLAERARRPPTRRPSRSCWTRATPTRTRARCACACRTRARHVVKDVIRGEITIRELGHQGLRDRRARTAARSTTSRWRSTTTTWASRTWCAARTTSRTPRAS